MNTHCKAESRTQCRHWAEIFSCWYFDQHILFYWSYSFTVSIVKLRSFSPLLKHLI